MQVLIVDDEPDVRLLLELNVRILGHEPVLATGAADAYAVCATTRPDAMLLDLSMPDGDGLSLLRQLRADGIEPASTVIVSAQTPEAVDRAALSVGVPGLSKPVTSEQLRDVLDGMLPMAA